MTLSTIAAIASLWAIMLMIWTTAFGISAVKVMYDSWNSYHVFEYIWLNPQNYWVKTVKASFIAIMILTVFGIIGSFFLP